MFAVMKAWLVPVDDVAPCRIEAGHDLASLSAEANPFHEPEKLLAAGRRHARPANLTRWLIGPDDDVPASLLLWPVPPTHPYSSPRTPRNHQGLRVRLRHRVHHSSHSDPGENYLPKGKKAGAKEITIG